MLYIKRFFKVFPEVYSIWQYKSSKSNYSLSIYRFAASLPSGESINQALLLPDSTFLLSTTSGLYYFSNSKTLSNAFGSIVSIFRVSLESDKNKLYLKNGYIADNAETIITKTSSVNRNLRFTLASIGCSEWGLIHGKVQYSSFLQGHDIDWTAWSSNQTRDVLNLSHGEYTLHVKARNFIGEESDIESLTFVVLPRFYQTQLFLTAVILLGFVGLFMVYQWRRYMHAKERFKLESLINKRTEELVKEKEKTENLLARVLPKDTADELKEKGRVNTQRFQVVTVLFCDIEGFTRITDETNPEALIDQLDKFFLYFDSVVEKYRIEKIKTIGDAYMCAGGIPKKNQTNPVEVILAALEMMQYMKHLTTSKKNKSSVWDLRIGIDTGPVIAGVVGRNKLSYDIWGSTVNTASRMESSGESGQINISGNTYMLVKDYFICTFRGKMPVKNKGDIQMYFVNGIKPSLSEKMKGIVPNQDFFIQLQIIRLGDLEDFILDKLEKGLPKNLYYHNLKHTVDVYTQVELIGRSENVTKEELLLLRTAALFHDAGHLIDYDTHEEMAVKLANEILPQYQYSDRQINIIAQLIMATKLPPNPTNLLEEIMCDADLDYLGRPDFIPVSNTLFKELHEHGKIGTEREWNEIQIKFINSHFYFTKTARRLRNVNKQSQLEKLKAWMDRN
jgi:class 3 adenylate cyclase